MLKDHLGNTRVLIKQNGSILDINDYYAFGLEIGDPMGPSPDNNYKYNGKEWNTDLSLNAYDYGARFYDPVIGRWNTIDPSTEKDGSFSPYNYGFNNPIRFTDPDGRWPWPASINQYFKPIQSIANNAVNSVRSTYNSAVSTTRSTYNSAANTASRAVASAKKWTVENKESLLHTAKAMQETGDKTAVAGGAMAVIGAPVAGVGAAPGIAVAGAGKTVSLIGAGLEIVVEAAVGSTKNAAITTGSEVAYGIMGVVGSKAIDQLIPGPTPDVSGQIKEATKQVVGVIEGSFKSQTDKTLERFKENKQ